jgi:oligosaccharide reducing-end xylanase
MDLWNGDVRSEGMSYGMMIALQMDRQDDFNAIWNWAKTYMYQKNPKHPCYGYFAWQMNKNGTPMDEMPAPDGEEYFIMSLFFASHRWGDGQGIYNYGKEALDLLDKFKNRPEITGVATNVWGTRTITGTALMNPEHKMVRFTPDKTNFAINGDHTDPSYNLPAFYELWALWGPEKDKEFWQGAAQASRDFFTKATHPKTGLTPDYANFDGTPVSASFNKGSYKFRWDAWRTAMNWGMDYHWWAKDPRQNELSNRIQAFFWSEGLYTHRQCYTMAGHQAEGESAQWHSIGLASTNGASSLAATDRRAWAFVDAVMGLPIPTGLSRYYDGMLFMFGLLHLSGNYKIYMPGYAEKVAAEKAAAEKAAAEKAAPEVKTDTQAASETTTPSVAPAIETPAAAPAPTSAAPAASSAAPAASSAAPAPTSAAPAASSAAPAPAVTPAAAAPPTKTAPSNSEKKEQK